MRGMLVFALDTILDPDHGAIERLEKRLSERTGVECLVIPSCTAVYQIQGKLEKEAKEKRDRAELDAIYGSSLRTSEAFLEAMKAAEEGKRTVDRQFRAKSIAIILASAAAAAGIIYMASHVLRFIPQFITGSG